MQYKHLLLLAALFAAPSQAASDKLAAPNADGGKIILTQDLCVLPSANLVRDKYIKDGEPLKYAYTIDAAGKRTGAEACYFIPKFANSVTVQDNKEGAAAIPVVNLFVPYQGKILVLPHLINEFTPYEEITL